MDIIKYINKLRIENEQIEREWMCDRLIELLKLNKFSVVLLDEDNKFKRLINMFGKDIKPILIINEPYDEYSYCIGHNLSKSKFKEVRYKLIDHVDNIVYKKENKIR